MADFLTVPELAALLRLKPRKIYELAAKGAVPVRKATGKLLFPRDAIERWIERSAGGEVAPAPTESAPRPPVITGGHDLLLEWALRESRSGLGAFLDGALDGIERAGRGECVAAALHIPEGRGRWNVDTVTRRFAREPWVLVEFAWRERGILLAPGVDRQVTDIRDVAGLTFLPRQPEAGSELVLADLLAAAKLPPEALDRVGPPARSESDLAAAIAAGKAQAGLGTAAAARQFGVRFVPMVRERFDLLVWRKAWFEPPFQRLLDFCSTAAFRDRARELTGTDVDGFGTVHANLG